MEFYVVDPKELDYQAWIAHICAFLDQEQYTYSLEDGGLYYLGDDVAAPWHEESVLIHVEGEDGGLIELRDIDRNFYVFSDDLSNFDDRELKEVTGYNSRPPLVIYGFRAGNQKGCRYHIGPSANISFFVKEEQVDYPPILALNDLWKLFFRSLEWIQQNFSRIQEGLSFKVERLSLDFEVDVQFSHPASLDALSEILAEEKDYEYSRGSLKATFKDRSLPFLMHFISLLPPDEVDFDEAFFRVVWRGLANGEEHEIFFLGVERRNLRPFIQMPAHRTSRALLEKLRAYLKGHRIDRQEYTLPL